ncbi:serine hydrolase [Sneathiella litorea]|uniref:Serine hydrolase n=1 Tax=Sneathiella litorea TaxID=2606216 RepID=A0A6L8W772_9PROT|nr:serine hydrolase [Sneathiella litorea]MZR30240.1 serine hydrolase [Sneathiella litorea]
MNKILKYSVRASVSPGLFVRQLTIGHLLKKQLAIIAALAITITVATGSFSHPSQAQDATAPVPASQIMDAVEQLDELTQAIMAETKVPGLAVAVVHQGKTLFAKGYGVREIGKNDPIDPDTVFQIASLSKSVSASVVAHQVSKGTVSWDDPVQQYLPWFQLQDPWISRHVSIGDLFAHRSGLPDHAGDDLEDIGYDRRYILEQLRYIPLHSFRNTYAYTNFGLTTGAEAVAAASGMDWESLSKSAVYEPLGMTSTSSRFEDYMAEENRAVGHALIEGVFKPALQRLPDPQSPAGGVCSTINDFSRWMIMILSQGRFEGKVIIDEAALIPAITPESISRHPATSKDPAGFYGYGVGVNIRPSGQTMLSHSGAFILGSATNYMMLPSSELGIAVFTNGTPVGAAEALTAQFMDLVQYGEVQREWLAGYQKLFAPMNSPIGELTGQEPPETPEPSAELTLLEGLYNSDYFGMAKLEVKNESLVLILGPDKQEFILNHWDGEVFRFPVFNENMPFGSTSSLKFALREDGTAKSFTIEFLNEFGLAVFDRQK